MKVLVTGGAGYIGSTVCSALIDAGHIPVIIDSLVTGCEAFIKNRIFYKGDIADHKLLSKISEEHPDIYCCIHFAARIIVPESVENPHLYWHENVVKSIAFFQSMHLLKIRNVIFSSSASIYKETEAFVVDEQSPLLPLSPYARTKFALEMALEDFCNGGYMHGISLRYFNPIGADKKMRTGPFVPEPSHILGKLVNAMQGKEKEFCIYGVDWPTRDGSAMRDYIHIDDLANAHVLAAEKFDRLFVNTNTRYHVFNVGSGNGVTVKDFVAAFQNVHGQSIPVKEGSRRLGDVVGAYANCEKAYKLLGWKARYNIEDGIKSILEWTSVNNDKKLGF